MISVGRCGKQPYERLGRMSRGCNMSKRQQQRPSILKEYAAAKVAKEIRTISALKRRSPFPEKGDSTGQQA